MLSIDFKETNGYNGYKWTQMDTNGFIILIVINIIIINKYIINNNIKV